MNEPLPAAPRAPITSVKAFVIVATVLLAIIVINTTLLMAKSVIGPPSPIITTNGVYTSVLESSCVSPPHQYIQFVVKVQNSGGTGSANVVFEVDGSVRDATIVHVGANTYVWVTDIVFLGDCSTHSAAADVISQWSG